MKEIEAEERDRRLLVGCSDLALGLEVDAVLQRVERGPALAIESHDLAVENHAVDGLLAELGEQARKRGIEMEAGTARAELHGVAVDEREHPVAVELGLPHPFVVVERC